MELHNLATFKGGWFIGNFSPSLLKGDTFETAVKYYGSGDTDKEHYHAKAIEITVIASGKAKINDIAVGKGDIIVIMPGESARFEAITDVVTMVVKSPSVLDDKFIIE